MKYYYVRRKSDGRLLDIPERDLQETLKRGFEFAGEIDLTGGKFNPPKGEIDLTAEVFSCPICEFKAKSEFGLKSHKRSHK